MIGGLEIAMLAADQLGGGQRVILSRRRIDQQGAQTARYLGMISALDGESGAEQRDQEVTPVSSCVRGLVGSEWFRISWPNRRFGIARTVFPGVAAVGAGISVASSFPGELEGRRP